ncbi:MAG: DUF92 domain-containing protein [Chloroflexi bacterium]|nr:DUF92 domain-containing protein [Chloroflexota bacterium]MCL5274302.1 DUF92 domain-containing protein [Chloroflexota bacterium]
MNPTAVVLLRLAIGVALSAVIGALAYRRKSLSRSGVAGAMLTGTLIFGLGGLAGGLLLVIFFVTSSALSRYKASRKQAVVELFDKGGQRDLGQALANGGIAALCAAGSGIAMLSGAGPPAIQYCLAGLIGALAAANADTWATELGVLSRTPPRLITRPLRVVEAGTSGGITPGGTIAAAAGALLIGLAALILGQVAALFFGNQPAVWAFLYNAILPGLNQSPALLIASFAGGLTGAFMDSLLGATVQAMYYSERRRKPTEKSREQDGTPNRLLRGWVWLNNDCVNLLASLTGACVSVLAFSILVT